MTGITVSLMFQSFFSSLARSKYLFLFHFLLFSLCGPLERQNQLDDKFSFFFSITTRSGLLAEIRWSVCISKSQRTLCISFSRMEFGLCIHNLLVWTIFIFLHNSQWITFSTQWCLVLYSLCASLLYSLIMQLIISSLSLHNLHMLFCCVLLIFSLI